MRISIEYEDKEILVVYKPAGLATQTAKVGQPDVVSELKNYLKGGYVGTVHRLDQPVEGLLVFGKTKEATAALTAQLQKGVLNKHYYAVVCGKPKELQGKLVDYLVKTPDNRAKVVELSQDIAQGAPKSAEKSGDAIPKKAVLNYQILDSLAIDSETEVIADNVHLVDIHIETGRFHQIRTQMSHAGLPLLGDLKYGTEVSGQISRILQVRNVALCACGLTLKHPKSQKNLEFQIKPQGNSFHSFAKKL